MEKILEKLNGDYLISAGNYNDEYVKKSKKFYSTLEIYIKDVSIVNELYELNADVELIAAKENFEAGFKYAIQLMKECELI